uniref:Secreted protein n=1 Tax=Taenia asiatica TaxID=60517 RepID=A0A0R3WG98_TAEAS
LNWLLREIMVRVTGSDLVGLMRPSKLHVWRANLCCFTKPLITGGSIDSRAQRHSVNRVGCPAPMATCCFGSGVSIPSSVPSPSSTGEGDRDAVTNSGSPSSTWR